MKNQMKKIILALIATAFFASSSVAAKEDPIRATIADLIKAGSTGPFCPYPDDRGI